MATSRPFEDILNVVHQQQEIEETGSEKKPDFNREIQSEADQGFSKIVAWLAKSQGAAQASLAEAHICVLASSYQGNSAVKDVSAFAKNASHGKEAINRLCVDHGIGLRVLEMAPEIPHKRGSDWSEIDCTKAAAFGMEAAASGGELLGLSAVAPGNIAGNIAIQASCSKDGSEHWLKAVPEKIRDEFYDNACQLVEKHHADVTHPLDAVRVFGGREVAASLGALLAARSRRIAVVFDGWAAISAYSVLEAIREGSCSHARLASVDGWLQQFVAERAGLNSLVGVHVDTGPGCGSALSVSILKGACDLQ